MTGTPSTRASLFKINSNSAKSLLRAEDREFLPAAIEILETPPSPIRMWLLQLICLFVTISIVWMFIGKIDIIAVAQGKIEPIGRVKTIEPLDTGKVRDIFVTNGSRVREGQLLVTLDDTELRAEEGALEEALASYRTEAVRRHAAIEAALSENQDVPVFTWPTLVAKDVLSREQRILTGDIKQLKASLASLSAQRAQKEAERTRLASTIASQEELLRIEDERVRLRATLEEQKLGSKLDLYNAMETQQSQRTNLVQQKGQLAEVIASIAVIEADQTKAVSTFVAENAQKLADAERQARETTQRLEKAKAKTAKMRLTAPTDGTVQALSITTIGQVVMAGEEVMRIVPGPAEFEVEAYMPNRDIGFVHVGQDAIVKLEAFPFVRYGALYGRVIRVSKEAIPEPDAQLREQNSSRGTRGPAPAGAPRVQNLVFPVTVSLQKQAIAADGSKIPVSNGMSASVEIRTGTRRIIDYVVSPLIEVTSTAMKEH